MKNKPIRYNFAIKVFVPVYQSPKGTLPPGYETFHFSYADACSDEQLVLSLKPDYVLELNGHFDATTKSVKHKRKKKTRGK